MFITLAAICLLVAESSASISGRVIDQDGQPVGGAIVVVSTARPRVGAATICPSCYPDCKKRTMTNRRGRFSFDGLSDSLRFRLAAGAAGFQGEISDYIDPADDLQTRLILKRFTTDPDSKRIRGQVLDATGRPVVGAEVRSRHIRLGNRVRNTHANVTPLMLTDEDGQFEATVGKTVSQVTFRTTAVGTATTDVDWTVSMTGPLTVSLEQGASIGGQLLFEGQPLVGALVGIVQSDRTFPNTVTPAEISTGADGFFRFDHLPAGSDYAIYTHTNQRTPGVLPVSYIQAPASGKLADLGELATQPAHSIRITVRTADGTTIPPNSRVYVARRHAWHTVWMPLVGNSPIATISMPGLGKERYEISVRVSGYKVQHTIPALQADINGRYPMLIKGDSKLSIIVQQR